MPYIMLLSFIYYFIFIGVSYKVMNFVLTHTSTNYQKLSYHKQTYVVANLTKSIALFYIIPSCCTFILSLLTQTLTEDIYHDAFLSTAIYSVTDLNSLFFEKGKQPTTVLHHIFVQIATFTCFYCGSFSTLTNIILVYGIFSTFAYSVNFFLAVRFLINNQKHIQILSTLAAVIYIGACLINWTFQVSYMCYLIYQGNYLYTGFLILFNYVVITDDIILILFLKGNSCF